MYRFFSLLLVLLLCLSLLTSCQDAVEVNDLAYVFTMGIDMGVSDVWRLSVQFPVMKEGKGQGQGMEGDQAKGGNSDYDMITMDAPSFFTGLEMIDSNLSRHLNFQHLKFIVISEEVAKSGLLKKYIAPLVRFREIRRTAYVLVCKGSAKEFLATSKTTIGSSLTKNMEDWINESDSTGLFPDTNLKDFYNNMKSPYQQTIAALANINKGDNFIESGPNADAAIHIKAKYTAGELPSKGGNDTELFGCAVFDGDKMVGTLDGYETRLLLMIKNEFKSGIFTVPDPKEKDSVIALRLNPNKKAQIQADLKGNIPRISIHLRLEGDILGLQSDLNYEGEELKSVLEQSVAVQLKEDIDSLIVKCKELNSDIFNFGGTAARQFSTVDEWKKYNWFQQFGKIQVTPEIDFIIRRSGTFIKSSSVLSGEEARQ